MPSDGGAGMGDAELTGEELEQVLALLDVADVFVDELSQDIFCDDGPQPQRPEESGQDSSPLQESDVADEVSLLSDELVYDALFDDSDTPDTKHVDSCKKDNTGNAQHWDSASHSNKQGKHAPYPHEEDNFDSVDLDDESYSLLLEDEAAMKDESNPS